MKRLGLARQWVKKNKILTIAIIGSLAGLLILYAYAASSTAVYRNIGDIKSSDIGDLVVTEGYVKDISSNSGGERITIVDIGTNNSIDVFISKDSWDAEKGKEILPGAKLKVQGIVDEYNGDLELVVGGSGSITVLEKAGSMSIQVDVLLNNPSVYEGMLLKTKGAAGGVRVVVDKSMLEIADSIDGNARIWVNVAKNTTYNGWLFGDTVTVAGTLVRDQYAGGSGRCEISVSSGDDELLSGNADVSGYADVSVKDLVTNPGKYLNERIAVSGTVFNASELVGTSFTLQMQNGAKYSLNCIVFGIDMTVSSVLKNGNSVDFSGVFSYYAPGGYWQMKAYSADSVIQ